MVEMMVNVPPPLEAFLKVPAYMQETHRGDGSADLLYAFRNLLIDPEADMVRGVHRAEAQAKQHHRVLQDENTAAQLAGLRAAVSATAATGADIRASRQRHEEAIKILEMEARVAEQNVASAGAALEAGLQHAAALQHTRAKRDGTASPATKTPPPARPGWSQYETRSSRHLRRRQRPGRLARHVRRARRTHLPWIRR